MTCSEAKDRLDDYVDGRLGEAEFQEVELHLQGCRECREEERLLRSLLAHAAALPREARPPRELWAGISARISGRRGWRFGGLIRTPLPLWSPVGLAAAAVVAATAAVLTMSVPRRTGPAASSASPATVQPAAFTAAPPQLLDAEREYARATAELMAALNAQQEALAPETVAMVERNLRTIDDALQQIREAVRQDPANPQLNHMLASTHQRKVDVLQQVLRLSTRL